LISVQVYKREEYPSMPMNVKDYPADWKAIRQRVVFDRAGGRCETPGCGARHGSTVIRQADGSLSRMADGSIVELSTVSSYRVADVEKDAGDRFVKIILTTAHLCNCYPKCGIDDHLRALCQRCHLAYDRPSNRAKAAETRRRRRGVSVLTFPPETDE
jgi:hypothetical protein